MATKKKAKKAPKSKRAPKKKAAKSKGTAKKPIAKKSASKKSVAKKSAAKKATRLGARKASSRRRAPKREFERGKSSQSGAQAGDLQGLRNVAIADSESVDELVDEGNAFEADVIEGVEHADDNEEQEVHTHEVPEDDVPEEYLDQD
jgi:hypothetical protein